MKSRLCGPHELGRRIIREGAQAIGIDLLGLGHEFIDEVRHLAAAAPADDVRRDLVRDAEREHGRMFGARFHGIAHGIARFLPQFLRIEKRKVFAPGDVHQKFEAVFLRQVQHPARRNVINADDVGVEFTDLREVFRRLLARGKGTGGAVRRERPVGNPL